MTLKVPLPFAAEARHFIGGAWTPPAAGDRLPVENPATGAVFTEVGAGTAADIDQAVQAAESAMVAARRTRWTPAQRQDALLALAQAVERHAEDFALLETLDTGKPISNSRRVDVPGTAATLRYFAGWATKLTGESMELSQPGETTAYTLREPVGVVGHIIPWNYPLMGAAFKLGPAIAAGCAVVLKPAEQSSLSALKLAELAVACGVPPGFFNVVTGLGPVVGAALVDHPGVAKISFTGSTATGTQIAADCARQMKRVTVELGGKSPVIVFADADLDAAARAIAMNIFFNSGQTCSAGSRLFVHRSVADALVEKIARIGAAMTIGDPLDPATQLGPVITQAQRARIMGFVEGALTQGASRAGGDIALPEQGYYVAPTVLGSVQAGMAAVDEEIFGPVLCAIPFDTDDLDEIAALANASRYGLSAYVWTGSLSRAHGMVSRLRAGTVRVNSSAGDIAMPAGGVRQSGFGRENGRAGVEAYTELKSVTIAHDHQARDHG
ncbi:phenylacetaldehyde dehydrogenase [Sphingobium sp. B11D3B]|uniref:aldehyde dehydrogenase family protein n=1 Tax=Sphingobium sp. B11D3B TaxID=2940575 RepID=UPI0022279733|nr:aldehyde dehydrogenase family protein [Sphingobium sp. B11D3B]MCW2388806.1 phenylacetaldehyde dehydrogenase [Sphingobium sp. B11D3B]